MFTLIEIYYKAIQFICNDYEKKKILYIYENKPILILIVSRTELQYSIYECERIKEIMTIIK